VLCIKEMFEDTKKVIRSCNSKGDRQWPKEKRTKGQTRMYKALHRKL